MNKSNEENEEIEEITYLGHVDLSEYYSLSEGDQRKWIRNYLEHIVGAIPEDISIERMAVKMIKQGADPEDEESPESTDFVDGTYRLQQSDLEDKHDKL